MQNLSKLSKTILFLCGFFFSLWTGSNFSKILLEYNFFDGIHFELKSFVNAQTVTAVTQAMAPVISISGLSFILFVLFFLLFWYFSGISARRNGWFFISVVLILALVPFELYLMIKFDKPYIDSCFWGRADGNFLLQNIIERFKLFSSFPVIEICGSLVLLYFFIFQPMTKNNEN